MNDLIARYEEQGLTLTMNEETMIALCQRPAPRARLGVKNEFHVRYRTVERMFEEPGMCNCAPGDPYGESSPETVLTYLRNKA